MANIITSRGERSLRSLIDVNEGTVSRELYVNEDIFAQELEMIYNRCWLFLGHESQLPNPGDFVITRMGTEEVLMVRDRETKQIRAFLNSCAHRGMKVCRYDEVNTPVFTCPYHGWSYATDGNLVGVPYFEDAYHEMLDKFKRGLVEVAQLENYKGSIWATWNPSAPAFDEYIGGFKIFLDLPLDSWDGHEGGTEVFAGVEKWNIPCNWKFPEENFIGDRYRRDTAEHAGSRSLDICFHAQVHRRVAPKGRGVDKGLALVFCGQEYSIRGK